jgi:type IV pilus assembly protein PilM
MFTIGLALEKELFRVAVLKKEKKSIVIQSLQSIPHGSENVKLFYNLSPFHTGKDIQIISGLTSSDLFIRKLHLPLRDKRKILSTLPFQLESLIPFPLENSIICPLLSPLSKQMTAVTVVATTRDYLSSHITALKEMDIEPDIISCTPLALGQFARWSFPQEFRILCFDVRDKTVSCVLLEGNELNLSQSILMDDQIDIALELEKLSIFLKQKGVVDDQTAWMLTGNIENFSEVISKIFKGQKLEISDPHSALHAISIGLALSGLTQKELSLQFCRKEFTQEHTWQLRRKKMVCYLGLCLGAALMMCISGLFVLNKKQHKLIENLQAYFPSTLSKDFISSKHQIQEKLQEWESSLRGQKSSFVFVPTVPKVSDVLAWLSAHPSFATEEGNPKEGMDIKSLHYSLVKYPKIGDTISPYAAQVELEFTSLIPRNARDFHEALLKGDQIVNAKKEMKWQTQNQLYHTSFELNKGIGS